jgi:CPA1 family monovalent cation:H+ antiporter
MTPFELVAALMTVVALAGWLNVKTLHVPNGVAMLIAGFAGAGLLFALQRLFPQFEGWREVSDYINRIDFVSTVTGYMLAFLLFAGAMQVDLAEMRKRWMSVSALATFGVAASIGIVGTGLWLIARSLGLPLPLVWALVFGALISPTPSPCWLRCGRSSCPRACRSFCRARRSTMTASALSHSRRCSRWRPAQATSVRRALSATSSSKRWAACSLAWLRAGW